jgi:hypothetical protein
MKFLKTLLFMCLVVALTVFQACNNDDPEPENEEELITTVTVTLEPVGGGTTVTLRFQDLDGDGGNPPTITGGTLQASTTYNAEIELLNETETPPEDITEEIEEEDDEHLFCFTPAVGDLTITITDSDGTYPVGLESDWVTGATTGDGTVQIVLKHQPGVKDGTCGPGDTDIDVTFPVEIE